eukprot:COSAG06_NODE_4528_length_4175_cov_3.406281_2_plen_73_part_00
MLLLCLGRGALVGDPGEDYCIDLPQRDGSMLDAGAGLGALRGAGRIRALPLGAALVGARGHGSSGGGETLRT